MKQTRILLIGATALALWGCGGGGGSSSTGVSDPLTAGRSALNGMASGTQPATTTNLQQASTLFQQAIQQNPGSSQAYFGAAVSLAGQIGIAVDGDVTSGGPVPVAATKGVTPVSLAHTAKNTKPTRDVAPPAPPGGGGGIAISIPNPPTTGDLPPAPPGQTAPGAPVPPDHTLGLFWNLAYGLSNPDALLHMLAPITDLRLGLMPFNGYSEDGTDIARRQKLLVDLNTVLADLKVVEADPNFTFTLPSPSQDGQTVTIGLPEVYLFDAFINSVRTEVALSLAYNRDPGTWQAIAPPAIPVNSGGSTGTIEFPPAPPAFVKGGRDVSPASPYAALDTNKDGKLTPNEYLPASPFLTLRDASLLQTAQQSIAAVADKEKQGITGVLARSATGTFLIPNTPDVAKVLTNIRDNVVPLIAQAATGPVTLTVPNYHLETLVLGNGEGSVVSSTANGLFQLRPDTGETPPAPPTTGSGQGGSSGSGSGSAGSGSTGSGTVTPTIPPILITTDQVTMNLSAWVANPPQDLKTLAPTYTLNSDGSLAIDKTTYPDSTFAGLFPNGLPKDLLF